MMKLLIKTSVLVLFAFFPAVTNAQSDETKIDALITETIRQIGGDDNEQDLKVLAQYPVRSAELLIKSLRVVRRGKYRQHPRTVWYIRALRFLTRLDFKASTNSRLTDDEKNFLGYDEQRRVKFFGTWMSRDLVFVGPKDAQLKIMRQWADWFTRNGKTHNYSRDTGLDDWYF